MFDWLGNFANVVEAKYGKETRERIFGDLSILSLDHEPLAE